RRSAADVASHRIGPAHARGHRRSARRVARVREEGVIAMLTEIVNHLWQSTLVVTAVAALAAMLSDHGADVRYWPWWAASVKFLVPFSLLTLLGSAVGGVGTPLIEPGDWPATLG